MNVAIDQSENEIIPAELAIKAMRDNGFKNTAYAIAELIDNSVQAKAKTVEVICVEKTKERNGRNVLRIDAIGVLDNGHGMDGETLRLALQFGNGTHLDDREGIGRFGMGLPNSSISQCRKVEVWTWTNGPENAIYSFLDLDKIESKEQKKVPIPEQRQLPNEYLKFDSRVGERGTFVLWTNVDELRLSWKGAQTTLRHTENIIGRMYRKFINRGDLTIRLLAISNGEKASDEPALPNDPLYLMNGTSTPEPFSDNAMFQHWGEEDGYTIEWDNSQVTIRMSFASEETLTEDGTERGWRPYGKHAAKNVGVSIVREGRELELDNTWANSYDPTERWWGVEVEFPATLDEYFGVTNNKQSATIFSQMAKFEWEDEAEEGESFKEFVTRLNDYGDSRALALTIADYIKSQLKNIRKRIKEQTEGTRRNRTRSIDMPNVEDIATKRFEERSQAGFSIDADSKIPKEDDRDAIKEKLVKDKHYPEKIAEHITDAILRRKQKVKFFARHLDSSAFFSVGEIPGGVTTIEFNMDHPLYDLIISSLNLESDNSNGDELVTRDSEFDLESRITKVADTLELLFAAWARYELEEIRYTDRRFVEFREEWGKMARFFLTERDNGN